MEDHLGFVTALPAAGKSRRKKASPARERLERMVAVTVPFFGQYSFYLGMLAFLTWGFFYFRSHYYQQNAAFTVHPREIEVHGNSVLSREYLLDLFGLNKPTNGFALVHSDIVQRLQTQMPLIKQVQMTYEPGKGLEVWVEERTPLARLANGLLPLAVDEEGVFFTYPNSREGYPEISGFDLPEEIEPGMRLQENLKCMLHLISATAEPTYRLPSRIRRITLLGSHPDDGLLLSLYDGRKIEIAWDGMGEETGFSDGMLKRLEQLAKLLRDPLLSGKRHFNAMAEGRIAVSD